MQCSRYYVIYDLVASYTDAWIEIYWGIPEEDVEEVASYTDAWIEIQMRKGDHASMPKSHPTRMRGLKFGVLVQSHGNGPSRILHGCVD